MPQGQIVSSISVGGIEFNSTISRTATGQESHTVSIPAGIAGTKASATSITGLVTGHGLVGSDVIDIHWTDVDGVTHKCRRGYTVDSAATNSITFDETPTPLGDALPADGTAVVVSKRVTVDTDWDFDLAEMFAAKSSCRMMADLWTSGATALALKLATEQAYSWANGQGITIPYTGNPIDSIKVSNGTVTAGTFNVGVLFRSA